MTVPLIITRKGVGKDWTAADFDSYIVLAELGVPYPAARVCRARRGRPLRRAIRSVLRTATVTPLPAPTAAIDRGAA
ncbi:hypothetical protein ACFC5T_40365 [Streptomyces sp. NPDC055961]|uniref:hypothetical protein n=1 Tax=Streptomyces sp. NPDC055961 TaxID=3345666 RepID=UPI0035DDC581